MGASEINVAPDGLPGDRGPNVIDSGAGIGGEFPGPKAGERIGRPDTISRRGWRSTAAPAQLRPGKFEISEAPLQLRSQTLTEIGRVLHRLANPWD
ncbi:MAG: hypothetical protein LC792_12265, partial [Actinobacteria bacterium]|nr:hypothetical protein [Actinomycetota bacterium]